LYVWHRTESAEVPVQEEAGRLVGSEKQQAKGLAKQVSGKVQKAVGDATELIKDATKTGA
jgi:uncharacterized protein YjbJ (UPF0337 family)